MGLGDWFYTDAYACRVPKGDNASIYAMKRHYFRYVDLRLAQMKEKPIRLFDRAIPRVLLPHLDRWSAATLPEVMDRLDAAGARCVPLARAQAIRAYAAPAGGNVITRFAKQEEVKPAPAPTPVEPERDIKALCR